MTNPGQRPPNVESDLRGLLHAAAAGNAQRNDDVAVANRLIANVTVEVGQPRRSGRSRWVAPSLAVAAAAVVALTVTGVAIGAQADRRPVGNQAPSTSAPTGSANPSPSATATTSTSATAASPAASTPVMRLVALAPAKVLNGTWTVPAWGLGPDVVCPGGTYTFKAGIAIWTPQPVGTDLDEVGNFSLSNPVVEDVTGDGVADDVVIVTCGRHETVAAEIVVLTERADGSIETVGRVAGASEADNSGVGTIVAVRPGTDGALNVQYQANSGDSTSPIQARTYRRVGGQFEQVGGPTAFPTADLSVRAEPVVLARRTGGTGEYSGTLTLTVHNNGPSATPAGVTVDITLPGPGALEDDAAFATNPYPTKASGGNPLLLVGSLPPLAAGASLTTHFIILWIPEPAGSRWSATVTVDAAIGDTDPANNTATFAIQMP
jgi:hypothetical protein